MHNLETIGHAAATYQRDPRSIKRALAEVQGQSPPQPALTLNGLPYFTVDDIAKAIGWMAEHGPNPMIHGDASGEVSING
jgi:hypothetical protein